MMFFWLIPVLLVLLVAMWFFFGFGTKRSQPGESRLDEARRDGQ